MLLPLISQTNIEAKYKFIITEYKTLQSITNLLNIEKENTKQIYDLQMERATVSNLMARQEIEYKYQTKIHGILIASEVIIVITWIGCFVMGVRAR